MINCTVAWLGAHQESVMVVQQEGVKKMEEVEECWDTMKVRMVGKLREREWVCMCNQHPI